MIEPVENLVGGMSISTPLCCVCKQISHKIGRSCKLFENNKIPNRVHAAEYYQCKGFEFDEDCLPGNYILVFEEIQKREEEHLDFLPPLCVCCKNINVKSFTKTECKALIKVPNDIGKAISYNCSGFEYNSECNQKSYEKIKDKIK